MTTYLLDTSVIIDVLNGKRGRSELLRAMLEGGDMLACCSINVTEIYAGMLPKEAAKTDAFLESLEYYNVSWEAARRAGLLKRDYARKGVTLSVTDTTIAAAAIEYGLMLMTDNTKHYPMPELKLYDLP
jgi:predicted nucleic acid-binding protein